MATRRLDIPRARPFQRFVHTEAVGGLLLLACAAAALVAANSPWSSSYESLWSSTIAIRALDRSLSLTLHQWINDGLMAVFFLMVGLEIKREVVAGELASPRLAALPIAAALGGMVVPAALYLAINHGDTAMRGWGIPMATDIAFALGALSIIAPRAPTGLKVFLAALAIVDDMGAVVVIALFYTSSLALVPLAGAGVILGVLVALNLLGVRRLSAYLALGVGLWFFVHASGIHATIAGVLLALTIPTRTRIASREFVAEARTILDDFDGAETGDGLIITSKGQQEALDALQRASEAVTAPLLRLEHALHGLSAFIVMPLFAFSNAGVHIGPLASGYGVAAGVALGLVAGKPLGITAASFAAVTLGLAALPSGVNWRQLHACAWLGGIGFTMSLFIANLAFEGGGLLAPAKLGIIGGSALAGLTAAAMLRLANPRN